MGLWIERTYPYISGAVTCGGYLTYTKLYGDMTFGNDPRGFLSMVNDVAAVLVGFLMATMSIVWAMQDRKSIQFQKQGGTYRYLIAYMFEASTGCLLSVLFNLAIAASITANKYITGFWHMPLIGAWIGLHVFCITSCYRVINSFYNILRSDSV